jgi:hypothetical protein
MILIRVVSWVVLVTLWFFVGLYLWIPTIVVLWILYILGVQIAAFLNDDALLQRVERAMEQTVGAFGNGFQRIHNSVWRPNSSVPGSMSGLSWGRLTPYIFGAVLYVAAATIVWTILLGLLQLILRLIRG